MTQQSTFPKWITYTLIGVVIILIASAILNVLTPEDKVVSTPLTTTNYDQTSSEFSNLIYTGPAIEVPASLSIAQATLINYEKKLKIKLIEQFNLKEIEDYDVWTSEDWALTVDPEGNRFTIGSQLFTSSLSKTITHSKAVSVAKVFLDTHLPQYQVNPLIDQAEYFEDQYGDPAKTTPSKAKSIKVAFGYSINGYPVFYRDNTENFIEIYVDSNKNIRKASFSTNDISLKNIGTKPALSPQVALQLANQTNRASIINVGYESPAILDFSNIISGEFDTVSIEYRVDPEQNLAYPFYHFSGFLIDGDNKSFSGEIITPAIEITPAN